MLFAQVPPHVSAESALHFMLQVADVPYLP
jgi:hypothetical protein